MKAKRSEPFRELPLHLERKRDLVTRRWLSAVLDDPAMPQAQRLTTEQLVDHLPAIYSEICDALKCQSARRASGRIERDARNYGHYRWMQGFQLDELYRELDLLRKCVQDLASDYFSNVAGRSRKLEVQAQRTIEELFGAIIHSAIRQLIQEQDQRLEESLQARDRAEAARQESEERLRIAAAAAGLGIFEWDLERGAGVWENARMYEITGQRPTDGPLSGDEFMRAVVHPDDVAELARQFDAGQVPGQQISVTFRIHRKNDQALRILELCGRFQFSDAGASHCFTGTLADITERRKAEESLREADRRKDVFLAMLAHELRNPLAPIRNVAQVMKDRRESLPSDIQWVQEVVERQSQHLSSLIDDLLDVSRITTGKIKLRMEVVDLQQTISHAVEIVRPLAEARHHRLVINPAERPVFVDADVTRLAQVMSNLLDNAIKYTNEHGEISISVRVTDSSAVIAVEDNGIGIAPGDLPHLFDLFVQVDPLTRQSSTGLGIGLSVVQSIVQMHGGDISATSAGPRRGSRFSVRLPLAKPPEPGGDAIGAASGSASRHLQILVVDDNRDAADSLAMVLRMNAHEVRVAENGPTALEAAAAWSPDVVLMDIGMPGMSGHDVARKLRTLPHSRDATIIALTGFGTEDDITRSSESGFARHLVKPVDPEMLLGLLNEIGLQ
ncbi:ATP-binding protein [Paraburkholderia sp. IW21]|uniref:hybrid sensor histidine kinase/response regulator n=1 Tax=Paraburkholderia sp. IW21 TaxID=3242488 RepID=UPI0035203D22